MAVSVLGSQTQMASGPWLRQKDLLTEMDRYVICPL